MFYFISPLEKLGWSHVKGNLWEKDGRQATYDYAVSYELAKYADEQSNPPAFGGGWRGRIGEWLVSLGNRIAQSGSNKAN